jgi:WD40 repeat protein
MQNDGDGIHSIVITPSGRYLFAGTENKLLKCWDVLGNGTVFNRFDVGIQEGNIKSLDISSDGWCIALSGTYPDELIYFY